MEIIIISIVALLTAILTFFSGFGLGTILTPVMMLFFPVEIAIALTGVVHFSINIFKLFLIGKNFDKDVLIRFGIPAVIFAFIGAFVLLHIPNLHPIFRYTLFGKTFEIYTMKLIVAVLMMFFTIVDLIPFFNNLQFNKNKLPIGGALSGFFGGLTGAQGALRSAFLIRSGMTKEAFIGTTVVISSFVDLTRLSVYSTRLLQIDLNENLPLISIATLSAISGAFIGNKLLKKVTLSFLQKTVAIMLLVISLALGLGFI